MANEWVRGTVTLQPGSPTNHTITNAMNVIESVLLQSGWVRASWSLTSSDRSFLRADRLTNDTWRYDADGPTQHCGIRITQENSDTEIWISSFLEDTAGTGVQIDTRAATTGTFQRPYIEILWDNSAANNYLMIAGEHGLYIEVGRDGSNVNLGHGSIVTMAAVPELNATRDAQTRWTTQGFPMDLGGASGCRFTESGSRNNRFVTDDGTNRNFTAYLALRTARSVTNVTSADPLDHRIIRIGNRDLLLGVTGRGGSSDYRYACTFGHLGSPEDDRYRISLIAMIQEQNETDLAVTSASVANNVAASGTPDVRFRDIRHDRVMNRFVVCDYTLLPFTNITDASTGIVYRVLEFNDNGRTANLGIEWPSTTVTPST